MICSYLGNRINFRGYNCISCKQNQLNYIILELPLLRARLIENVQSLCNKHGSTWDNQLSNDI